MPHIPCKHWDLRTVPGTGKPAGVPRVRPVCRSQAGAAAWVHHRHSSKTSGGCDSRSSRPASTATTLTPSCSSSPFSCTGLGLCCPPPGSMQRQQELQRGRAGERTGALLRQGHAGSSHLHDAQELGPGSPGVLGKDARFGEQPAASHREHPSARNDWLTEPEH